jgi:hypothetical protein
MKPGASATQDCRARYRSISFSIPTIRNGELSTTIILRTKCLVVDDWQTFVGMMNGHNIGLVRKRQIAVVFQPCSQCFLVTLYHFNQQHRMKSCNAFCGTRERLKLHAFNVDFYQINAAKIEGIETDSRDLA